MVISARMYVISGKRNMCIWMWNHVLFASLVPVKLVLRSIYTVSQKNCANLFFVTTLSNFDRSIKFLAQR